MSEFTEAIGPWDEPSQEARLHEAEQMQKAKKSAGFDRSTGQRLMKENFKAFPDLYDFTPPEEQ